MRAHEKTNLLKAGLFVSAMLVIIMIFIFTLGSENALLENKIDLKTKVKNAENLKVGAVVQLKGLKVGSVASIKFITVEELEITMRVVAEHIPWIKKDSLVAIKTTGVLGDKFVEIVGGTEASESVKENDYLIPEKSLDMKDLLSKGGNIVNASQEIMAKINILLSEMEDGKTLANTIKHLESTTGSLSRIMKEVEKKNMNTVLANMDKTSQNLVEITNRINKGPGTIHSLIYDDSAFEDLKVLLGGAQRSQILKFFIRESIKKAEEVNKK